MLKASDTASILGVKQEAVGDRAVASAGQTGSPPVSMAGIVDSACAGPTRRFPSAGAGTPSRSIFAMSSSYAAAGLPAEARGQSDRAAQSAKDACRAGSYAVAWSRTH